MPGGRPSKLPSAPEIIRMKKKSPKLTNKDIGEMFGTTGQAVNLKLARHKDEKGKKKQAPRHLNDELDKEKGRIDALEKIIGEKDLIIEKLLGTVSLMEEKLLLNRTIKPKIPTCPGCGDLMKEYRGGGWHCRTYRAQCLNCGRWQRVPLIPRS